MKLKRDIVPITQLRNQTARLVRAVSAERRTLVVTQNGEAKVVVMDVHEYDRLQETLALLKLIAQGEADVRAGRVRTIADALASAEEASENASRDT